MINLEEIKGLGPKNLKLLNKLGINNSEDLLSYYPYRYDVLKRTDFSTINDGDKIIIDGVVENIPSIFRYGRKADRMTFRLVSDINIFSVTIFNRGFLRTKLTAGTTVTVVGKYDQKRNSIVASDIKFMKLENKPIIEPVYHLTSGITNKQFNNYIGILLEDFLGVLF